MTEVSEELPVKLQTFIANFEKREALHTQDMSQKLAMVQETSIRSRDQMRSKLVEVLEQVQRLEMQHRETDYKLSAAQKQIEINTTMI